MTLSIVNTKPGDSAGVHIPGRTVEFGLRSVGDGPVRLQSVDAMFGHTALTGKRSIPQSSHGATVSLTAVKELSPVASSALVSLGPELTITKTTDLVREAGIYKVSVPCGAGNPILGLVRFQAPSGPEWSPQSREWTETGSVRPPFFSLLHGGMGTGLTLYLQENGAGSRLFLESVPQSTSFGSSYGASYVRRPIADLPAGSGLSLAVYLDPGSRVFRIYPVDSGGAFLDPIWEQSVLDLGPLGSVTADGAVLYFGNCGGAGSVVRVLEWGLYPDFRLAVNQGAASPDHGLEVLPDTPHVYSPSDGYSPDEGRAASWRRVGMSSVPLNPSNIDPTKYGSFTVSRVSAPSYLYRYEPQISDTQKGCLLEASVVFPVLTLGDRAEVLRIDDGSRRVSVVAHTPTTGNVLLFGAQSVSFVPDTYTMLRIVIDRVRSKAFLFVNDALSATALLSEFEAASSGGQGFYVGLINSGSSAELRVRHLCYLNHYLSYESINPALPPWSMGEASLNVVTTAGQLVETASGLRIQKTSPAPGNECTLTKEMVVRPEDGFWAEFRLTVESISTPSNLTSRADTGIGVSLEAFDRRLYLGLFDCGSNGRRVGIIPGSGTVDDILDGTALGLKFSAPVTWEQDVLYRVECIPGKAISVWVGGARTRDAHIVIPWDREARGFDLPQRSVERMGLSFGHFPSPTTANTKWSFFRWGVSSGFDLGIRRAFTDGYPSYLFGGKFLTNVRFQSAN